jgi:hypothetical protein
VQPMHAASSIRAMANDAGGWVRPGMVSSRMRAFYRRAARGRGASPQRGGRGVARRRAVAENRRRHIAIAP